MDKGSDSIVMLAMNCRDAMDKLGYACLSFAVVEVFGPTNVLVTLGHSLGCSLATGCSGLSVCKLPFQLILTDQPAAGCDALLVELDHT